MQNTYQDLITDIQSKNPEISGKLEGGKKFKIKSDFKPAGDQPEAIKKLVQSAKKGNFSHSKSFSRSCYTKQNLIKLIFVSTIN